MNPYYFSFSAAALTFPVIAFFSALPYAVYSYRKYGAISIWRTLVLASFVLYLECAYFVTVLPLPDPAVVTNSPGAGYNLVPFYFVYEFLTQSSFVPSQLNTWLPALKSGELLSTFYNCFLLLPFGIYLSYYFKCNWKKVLLFSFLFSLFFEITQITALYGLYPKPYRVFDVDDLVTNTFGAMIGYFIYTRFLRFLPDRDRIDQKSRVKGSHVGYLRRLTAFAADYLIISLIGHFFGALTKLDTLYTTSGVLCIYTIGVSLLTKGRTAGKALVRIKVRQSKTGSSFALAVTSRYLCRNGMIFVLFLLDSLIESAWELQRLWVPLYFGIILFVGIDVFYSLLKRKGLWYERLSWTENVSTFKEKAKKAEESEGAPA